MNWNSRKKIHKNLKTGCMMGAVLFFILSVIFRICSENTEYPFAAFYESNENTVSRTDIKCYNSGSEREELTALVEEELSMIPDSFKEKFMKDGWKIYITNENLSENYFNGIHKEVYGCTFYDKGLILLSDSETAVRTATVHEFGHWLDHHYGTLSSTDYFLSVYEKEYASFENVFKRNCIMDVTEYFAESFYQYVKNKEQLKDTAPITYRLFYELEKDAG